MGCCDVFEVYDYNGWVWGKAIKEKKDFFCGVSINGKIVKNQFLSILPEWESPQKAIFIDFTRLGKSSKINFYRFYQTGKVVKNQFLSILPDW